MAESHPRIPVEAVSPHPTDTVADPTSRATLDDVQRYLSDLQTIRTLMARYEEQPLVHHWVFAVWGLLVIIGTAINTGFNAAIAAAGLDALVVVWLPLLLIGSVAETAGAVLKSRDTGIPLLTHRRTRLFIASIGILILLGIVIAYLDRVGFTTSILIALGSTPLLIYALATFSDLFYEAFLLLALALIAAILGPDTNTLIFRAAGGALIGFTYIFTGFHSYRCEHRLRRRSGGPERVAATEAAK